MFPPTDIVPVKFVPPKALLLLVVLVTAALDVKPAIVIPEVNVVAPKLFDPLVLVTAPEEVKPSTTAKPVTSIPLEVVVNFVILLCLRVTAPSVLKLAITSEVPPFVKCMEPLAVSKYKSFVIFFMNELLPS